MTPYPGWGRMLFEHVDDDGTVVKRSIHQSWHSGDVAGRSTDQVLTILRDDFGHDL